MAQQKAILYAKIGNKIFYYLPSKLKLFSFETSPKTRFMQKHGHFSFTDETSPR
jgi:hypothetical protein